MRRQLSASLIKHSELFLVDIEGGNRLAQFCAITATTTANTAADVNQRSRCLNIYNVDALSDKKLSQSMVSIVLSCHYRQHRHLIKSNLNHTFHFPLFSLCIRP